MGPNAVQATDVEIVARAVRIRARWPDTLDVGRRCVGHISDTRAITRLARRFARITQGSYTHDVRPRMRRQWGVIEARTKMVLGVNVTNHKDVVKVGRWLGTKKFGRRCVENIANRTGQRNHLS